MKPVLRYPGKFSSDFSAEVSSEVVNLLLMDMKDIFRVLRGSEPPFLVAVLRKCLESELTERNVAIIGWFALNSLMPVPTLYVFMSLLMSKADTEEGARLCIVFGKALLPRLHNYIMLCRVLMGIPNLQYLHPDLFAVVKQVTQETIEIDNVETLDHYVVPGNKQSFVPFREIHFPKFDPGHGGLNEHLLSGTLAQSVMYAGLLRGNEQKGCFIQIMNQFGYPLDLDSPPLPMLQAACEYANFLLENDATNPWTDFRRYEQIERVGAWIGIISRKRKRPPPLKWMSVEYVLRWAIAHGTIRRALAFLTGFLVQYKVRPPNCYAVILFEILAAVKQNRFLKESVVQAIEAFEARLQINLKDYARRSIDVPINSIDRCANFVSLEDRIVFESPDGLNPGSDVHFLFDARSVATYFHYTADLSFLPPEFQEMSEVARIMEHYFFQGTPACVTVPNYDLSDNVMMNSLLAMTWSGSSILSQLAARMFYKLAKAREPIDLSHVFRIAFPNRLALSSCLDANCVHPEKLNSLFCDLLTNPLTKEIALPKIKELLPLCLANSNQQYYEGVLKLCDMQPGGPELSDIGLPDAKHYQLLEAFMEYCEANGEKPEFVEQLRNTSMSGFRSLLLFVFHVTKKTSSPLNPTKIDYSTIDFLCYSMTKCVGKPKFEERLVGAIKSITQEAIVSMYPLSLFRLLYGLLNIKVARNEESLIQFIEYFEPRKYPTFTCCWIQLCTHRTVFPRLLQLNTSKTMSFCVRFVLICLELAKQQPDIFYKSVTRILMTIASSHPLFFVSYHALFLEKLPLLYTQFRNIILGAQSKNLEDVPPMGFKCATIVSSIGQQSLVKDSHFSDEKAEKVAKAMSRALVPTTPYVPRIVWALALYYLSSLREGVTDFFVSICSKITDSSVRMLYVTLIDQLRYDNRITRDVTDILLAVFEKCDDMHKELIFVELLRRMMCVTKPPASVFELFQQIMARFKDQIVAIMKRNGELKAFEDALEVVTRTVYQLY